MVYADLGQYLRLFDIDDSGRAALHPNTEHRRIHLCVDGLSAKMWRYLKFNLLKKLSELNSAQYVEPLLEAFKQVTVQHDYLHEIRMHCQDVIYRQFYACVLQAFQVQIRIQRVNGDPVKNGLQAHEGFLEIVYKAMTEHLMDKFLEHCGDGYFCRQPDESVESLLMRFLQCYEEYCESWNEECTDTPSKLCYNLLTMLEAYLWQM